MASCKDCVHYEVCQMHYKQKCELTYESEREVEIAMRKAQKAVDIECDHFKDRSRFVELPQPVKPGDKLWYILDGLDAIDLRERKTTRGNSAVGDDPDIVFDVSTRGFWIVGVRRKDTEPISFNDCFLVPWDEFGKTYFLSREAAEQALKLKEREENA